MPQWLIRVGRFCADWSIGLCVLLLAAPHFLAMWWQGRSDPPVRRRRFGPFGGKSYDEP